MKNKSIPYLLERVRGRPFLLIILLCIVSRLPQLLSPELLLDGDECVIGLMAKHFIEGKEIPVFFHGQAYGFSFIETALVSFFYSLWGMSDICVKLPMLLMWTAGILFFYKALTELSTKNKWLPLLVILVFIFSPSWALWSMKARGGYLTSFFFSSLLLWLACRKKGINSNLTYFFIGLILVIIYQSQPFWLPGLLPIIIYKLYPQVNKKRTGSLAAGIIPLSLVFLWLKLHAANRWSPHVIDISFPTFSHNFKDIPLLLYNHFNGYYYLYYIYNAPLICNIFSCLLILLTTILIVIAIASIFKHYKQHSFFIVSVVSILITIGYTLFLRENSRRYVLPLTGFVLFAFFVLSENIQLHVAAPLRLKKILCIVFILTGIPSIISFKDYTFYPARRAEVLASVDYLQKHDIHYCFSNDGLLQWQIMFYSHEKIICRESDTIDRYPEYVEAVTDAFVHDRQHVAIIDDTKDLQSVSPDKAVNVISHFYIVLQPSDQVLKDMEFKF